MIRKYPANKFYHEIETLKKIANQSTLLHKHGACLLHKSKIVSIGYNKYFNIWNYNGIKVKTTIHAEIDTISKYPNKYVKGMDIMIIRIGGSNTLRNSRPCNSCIDTLKKKGIRKVYYSTDEGHIMFEYIRDMSKIHISSGNICIRRLFT